MKVKKILKAFLLSLVTIVFLSCGSSDNDEGVLGSEVIAVTITSNSSAINLGESFTLTVRDNNNVDKTSKSTIRVDGVTLIGNVFTPSSEGVYSVNAKFGGFTSANILLTVNDSGVPVIIINSDKYLALYGDTFTFSVAGNGGADLSADATYSVNGTEILENFYTPTQRGNYVVTASYDGLISNEITVVAGYVQKVLVEDYTGTWCGWCPILSYALEQAEDQSDDVYGVALHNNADNLDPMVAFDYEEVLSDIYNVTGYPDGRINRTAVWDQSIIQLLNSRGVNATLGLGLETSLSGTSINIDIKIGYVSASTNMKLVMYLLEDGKIFPQRNYSNTDSTSPWYQLGDPIPDFMHNNILRKVFTDVLGDVIPDGTVGGEYKQAFAVEMPLNVEDNTKLEVIAFVVDSEGKAINAMRVNLGESQDYQ